MWAVDAKQVPANLFSYVNVRTCPALVGFSIQRRPAFHRLVSQKVTQGADALVKRAPMRAGRAVACKVAHPCPIDLRAKQGHVDPARADRWYITHWIIIGDLVLCTTRGMFIEGTWIILFVVSTNSYMYICSYKKKRYKMIYSYSITQRVMWDNIHDRLKSKGLIVGKQLMPSTVLYEATNTAKSLSMHAYSLAVSKTARVHWFY